MNSTFPKELTINGLRASYLSGEFTPREIAYEIVRRAASDESYNIWITPPSLELLEPYLQRLEAIPPEELPLWGIPFAVKDNIDLAGIPTTAGCADFAYTPESSAFVVARLIGAGAIPVGKTNLDQFATGLVGTRSPYGETHNALRPELISGGSSSGSAVAVARGQAAFSLGTDTAGSGRVPAALNGLVGYKPAVGAWSSSGVVPACKSLDCVTVFAHCLEDAEAVDRCARGVNPEDPASQHRPVGQKGLPSRILLPQREPEFYGPYADKYRSAWRKAVEGVESSNIPIAYADDELFAEAAAVLYEGPWIAERWASLGGFTQAHPGSALPVTEAILRSGGDGKLTAASLFRSIHRLSELKLEAAKLLQDAVLLMPTCGGTWTREQVRLNPVGANSDMGRYTNHCNLLDLSAVALPAGVAGDDLPFGITLFSLPQQEHLLRGAAAVFMRITGQSEADHSEEHSTVHSLQSEAQAETAASPETTLVAVCGLHMRGFPLEKQMIACGAKFIREDITAAKYRLIKLATTPAKPGLLKQTAGGRSISLEVWEMPLAAFGGFAASIPGPLGIGKVELADGTEVPGFICEGYGEAGSADITSFGGWRNAVC
ncbi:allophanate hydrolase [Paenibacillus beijingensis]|uniref:Allophanate hydrolase n=1 Tax=Paenibacillus beijingensis TaxID=1126833 RepID=A0A0D5NNY4_9BACL|nr:allophanate hydrolase [Paenibacillus beijingensis]AJY76981.1 allophanate hydrolase [Paenibacillus beijingensis]